MKVNDTVLMSIKPIYAMRIFNGSKRYEFRKRHFPASVRKVVVYASKPVGRVIGEFNVSGVEKGAPDMIWGNCREFAGIKEKDFFAYFKGTPEAVAIRIEAPMLYNPSLQISRFCKRPPQSYCYI